MNFHLASLLLLLPSFLHASTPFQKHPAPNVFKNHQPGYFRGVSDADLVAFASNANAHQYGQHLTAHDLNDIAQITRERGDGVVCPHLGRLLSSVSPEVLAASSISMACLHQAFNGVVTAENFALLKYKLIQAVEDSEFIALDAEFSGIEVPAHGDHPGVAPMAFFDTRQERYAKLTEIVEHMGLLQVGLSFYIKNSVGAYEASNFSFYLEQPRNLLITQGAKEALGDQFDFDMCFDHGIPMNQFAELIYAMKGLNKPLAVYNGTYDLAFLMKNCFGAIPSNFEHFKMASHALFPTVVDVKYLADVLQSSSHNINNKDLSSLMNSLPMPKDTLKAPGLSRVGFHDAGYDALITGCTFLSLIDIFGLGNVLSNSNIIREGGRTIYKHYSLIGGPDHVPSTRFLFTVSSNLQGINNPAGKLASDLKAFSGRDGSFSQGFKTDVKNGQLMVMFTSQAEVDLFNNSTKFGLGYQGKTPNYTLHQCRTIY